MSAPDPFMGVLEEDHPQPTPELLDPAAAGTIPDELVEPGGPAMAGPSLAPPPPAPPTIEQVVPTLAMGAPPGPAPDPIPPRERLLYGPAVLAKQDVPRMPDVAPPLEDQIAALTGKKGLNDANVKVGARLMQYTETAPDPDAAADDWKRIKAWMPVVQGRTKELLGKFLDGSELPDEEWDELSAAVTGISAALKPVGEDLKIGAGRVVSIEPDLTQVQFDLSDDTTLLPATMSGMPSGAIPMSTMTKTAKDVTVFITGDDVTYAMPVTPETAFAARQYHPGPVGQDGLPRWTKSEPVRVFDHSATNGIAQANPAVVTESYVDPNSYVGLQAGDWIVYDVPARRQPKPWKHPIWMDGKQTAVRGGVARTEPELRLDPLTPADIGNADVFEERLVDTAWAVVQAQGDPKTTARMLAKLKAEGLTPVEVQGGKRKSWMVFGVSPEVAAAASPNRPVHLPNGTAYVDEPDEEDAPTFTYRLANGSTARITPDTDEAVPYTNRTQYRADRYAYRVPPEHAQRISGLANDLEARGARGLALYTSQSKVDGYEPAREHLYSDGVSLQTVRTKSPQLGDRNAVAVHVRSTRGLPESRPEVSREAVDTTGVPYREVNGRLLVEAGDDLAEGYANAASLAARVGWDKVRLAGPNGYVRIWEG